jgi:hypothetical protein
LAKEEKMTSAGGVLGGAGTRWAARAAPLDIQNNFLLCRWKCHRVFFLLVVQFGTDRSFFFSLYFSLFSKKIKINPFYCWYFNFGLYFLKKIKFLS